MNLPSPSQCSALNESEHSASFLIEPFYPGYGTTVGNALRRVLLSSLEGTAISGIKIKGVSHEFSTLQGVKEDFVDIILNLKGVVVKAEQHADVSTIRLSLSVKGERAVTAGDIDLPTGIEVMNPKHVILNLTSASASIEMDIALSRGRGFLPIENREHEDRELGFIAVDSLFSPVTKVGFSVEDVRVGQMTNFDKVRLDIETNGVVTPREAVEQSLAMLVEQIHDVQKLVQESAKSSPADEGSSEEISETKENEGEEATETEEEEGEQEEKPKKRAKKKKEEE